MFELIAGLFGLMLGLIKLSFGLVFLLLAGLYFVPSIIAIVGKKDHAGWIVAANLLFGWTAIGWLIALIWAIVDEQRATPLYYRRLPG